MNLILKITIWFWISWIQNLFKHSFCLIFIIDDNQFWQGVPLLSKWWLLWISNFCKIADIKNVSDISFKRNIELIKKMKLLQNSEKFISSIIQSSHWLIADKVLNIDHDFILNHKVFYTTSVICLFNYITLSFCEVVISNQEYLIYNFSNLNDRIDLKFLLHCGSFCDIRIKKHAETEIFIEIKWCYFNKSVDSIVISKFNYW